MELECSIGTWKHDWIGPSYSLIFFEMEWKEEILMNEEKDLMTSKELNEDMYEVKISCTIP